MAKEIEAQEERAGRVFPGNLYRRIRDLLSRGLIEEVPPPEGLEADPRRKYYGATPLGEAVAGAEGRRLESLAGEARALGLISGG
jgi:DNA-binding PadR family transcriptional regulator